MRSATLSESGGPGWRNGMASLTERATWVLVRSGINNES